MTERNLPPPSGETIEPAAEPPLETSRHEHTAHYHARNSGQFVSEKCAVVPEPNEAGKGRIVAYQWIANANTREDEDYTWTSLYHTASEVLAPHKSGGRLHFEEMKAAYGGDGTIQEFTRTVSGSPTYDYGFQVDLATGEVVTNASPMVRGEYEYTNYIFARASLVAKIVANAATINYDSLHEIDRAFRSPIDPAYGSRDPRLIFWLCWQESNLLAAADIRNHTSDTLAMLRANAAIQYEHFYADGDVRFMSTTSRWRALVGGTKFVVANKSPGSITFAEQTGIHTNPQFNAAWIRNVLYRHPLHTIHNSEFGDAVPNY